MIFDSANIRLLTTLLFLLIMQQSQSLNQKIMVIVFRMIGNLGLIEQP